MWALRKTDFGHGCTTSEGSSGSPVIDAHYKVIGLHHLGFDGSGRWASENRAVKASQFAKLIETLINSGKSD
jgi:V8-like Glu-specific endopeptidase